MKLRRIIAVAAACALAFCLTGCDVFSVDTDTLIAPPEISGDMYPVSLALARSVKGEYQLKYPSLGDYRSAIVLEDIDSNGELEAFAFYSTADDEMTNMHINMICRSGEDYESVADMSIVAGGVEQVAFCDFDGDGTKEILVGWEVYGTSEKQICVYSLSGGKSEQLLSEKYTGFLCCDIAEDGGTQLLLHQLNTSEMTNSAVLYRLKKGKFNKAGSCVLDPEVKTTLGHEFSKLSTGKSAVFIDEIKGVNAITEVLIFKDGELKNPLLSTENTIENIRTLRAASLRCRDIDGNGTLEIPVATNLPNAAGTEELLYYTNWCAFDGENLVTRQITVVNTIDGYYLKIPEKLVGRIAVLKDTDNHRRVLYYYDVELGEVGERMASVTVVAKDVWDGDGYNRSGMFEIERNSENVFAGKVNKAAREAISEEEFKEMFNLN